MIRCGVLFNSTEKINSTNYYDFINNAVINHLYCMLYKFNNDYYIIIEGEENDINKFINKLIENKDLYNIEIKSFTKIDKNLLKGYKFKELNLTEETDYSLIKDLYYKNI